MTGSAMSVSVYRQQERENNTYQHKACSILQNNRDPTAAFTSAFGHGNSQLDTRNPGARAASSSEKYSDPKEAAMSEMPSHQMRVYYGWS